MAKTDLALVIVVVTAIAVIVVGQADLRGAATATDYLSEAYAYGFRGGYEQGLEHAQGVLQENTIPSTWRMRTPTVSDRSIYAGVSSEPGANEVDAYRLGVVRGYIEGFADHNAPARETALSNNPLTPNDPALQGNLQSMQGYSRSSSSLEISIQDPLPTSKTDDQAPPDEISCCEGKACDSGYQCNVGNCMCEKLFDPFPGPGDRKPCGKETCKADEICVLGKCQMNPLTQTLSEGENHLLTIQISFDEIRIGCRWEW